MPPIGILFHIPLILLFILHKTIVSVVETKLKSFYLKTSQFYFTRIKNTAITNWFSYPS